MNQKTKETIWKQKHKNYGVFSAKGMGKKQIFVKAMFKTSIKA